MLRVRLQLGRHRLEQAVAGQGRERLLGMPGAQNLVVLLDHSRRRGVGQAMPVRGDRLFHRRIEREAEPRAQHHRAQHAHRIFLEALVGIAD